MKQKELAYFSPKTLSLVFNIFFGCVSKNRWENNLTSKMAVSPVLSCPTERCNLKRILFFLEKNLTLQDTA
jgi:hypothetical protein